MSKIKKNYFYNILYQIFAIMVPLITAPYLARVLGAKNQGIYSYVNSVTYMISIITLLGIFNYGNRQIAYVRDDKDKMSQTFWELMVIRVVLSIIGTIIFFFIANKLEKYNQYFKIYYLYLLAQYIDCTWVFVGLEDMKFAVIKNFITKLLSTIGIFIFVKDSSDVDIYLFLLGLSVLISNLLVFTQLRIYISKFKIKLSNIFIHIKGSVKLFLPSVATILLLQTDKIMIELLTKDTMQVSFYDNSEKIVTLALTIITVLSTVMMPRIANEYSKGNMDNIKNLLIKCTKVSLFLAFPMMIGLMVTSWKFIPWYLGEEYHSAIYGIVVISPILIINSLEGISGKQYFTALNKTNILMKSYILAGIINIILNLILISNIGFIGAAIATVISSGILVIIQYYYLNKEIDMKEVKIYSLKYFKFSIIMGIVVLSISFKMKASIITSIVQIIIGIITYSTICTLKQEEIFLQIITNLKKIKINNK